MKFLSITGPKEDIDRVIDTYLSKYEIHLENALSELKTVKDLRPYIEINPYRDTYQRAAELVELLPASAPKTTSATPSWMRRSKNRRNCLRKPIFAGCELRGRDTAIDAISTAVSTETKAKVTRQPKVSATQVPAGTRGVRRCVRHGCSLECSRSYYKLIRRLCQSFFSYQLSDNVIPTSAHYPPPRHAIENPADDQSSTGFGTCATLAITASADTSSARKA